MKLTFIFLLLTATAAAQPPLSSFNSTQQKQIRDYVAFYINPLNTSVKKINDTIAAMPYVDSNYMPTRNNKLIVNFKLPYDSTGKVASSLSKLTVNVNNIQASYVTSSQLNTTNTNVSNLKEDTDIRLSSLEGWRTATNIKLTLIDTKIATIPKSATSISTTTTITELKP